MNKMISTAFAAFTLLVVFVLFDNGSALTELAKGGGQNGAISEPAPEPVSDLASETASAPVAEPIKIE